MDFPLRPICRKTGRMGKASRRQAPAKAPKAATRPGTSGRRTWSTALSWVIVLGVALAYRFYNDRRVAERELPREGDIFVVSYPKSGNFWVRFLLAHTWLYSGATESEAVWHREIDFNSIEDTIPDLEYGPNRRDYYLHDKLRAFKSHQPFVPAAVPGKCAATVGRMDDYQCACPNCPPKWRRILHMVRDGRDVMCSYYHFRQGLRNLEPPDMSFEEFLKADLYPGLGWADHVKSYLDLRGNSTYDILTVKYEDLQTKQFETMTEIVRWAGLDHNEKAIRRAMAKSSFKSMRKKEEATGLRIFDEEYTDRDRRWRMTRKGQAGGWEECFTTPVSKDIWNELAFQTMRELGYVSSEGW